MERHQFDLSAGVVKIDYQELLRTAQAAVFLAKEELHRDLQKWFTLPTEGQPSNLDAEGMLADAGRLAQATTTLHYLRGGLGQGRGHHHQQAGGESRRLT